MNRSTAFWDKIAERYSKQPIADEAAYQKKLQVTQEYLKPEMEALEAVSKEKQRIDSSRRDGGGC